jgi:hypothetical protein
LGICNAPAISFPPGFTFDGLIASVDWSSEDFLTEFA